MAAEVKQRGSGYYINNPGYPDIGLRKGEWYIGTAFKKYLIFKYSEFYTTDESGVELIIDEGYTRSGESYKETYIYFTHSDIENIKPTEYRNLLDIMFHNT